MPNVLKIMKITIRHGSGGKPPSTGTLILLTLFIIAFGVYWYFSTKYCYKKAGMAGVILNFFFPFIALIIIYFWKEHGILGDHYVNYAYFRCKHCKKQWRVSYETQKDVCKKCYGKEKIWQNI